MTITSATSSRRCDITTSTCIRPQRNVLPTPTESQAT